MIATIEDVKKFWNDRPCNIRHSSKELGSLEYFNEVSKKKFYVEPHILDFTKFPQWKNKKVLEIGCMLHNSKYDFNDEIIPLGISYWYNLVENQLSVES